MAKGLQINNEFDYKKALKKIEKLMDKDPIESFKEADELRRLSRIIGDYETINFPSSLPDPIEAIKFRMEQQDLKQVDLVVYIGNRARVSEILSYRRALSLCMIRRLYKGLGISLEVLIQPYKIRNKAKR